MLLSFKQGQYNNNEKKRKKQASKTKETIEN